MTFARETLQVNVRVRWWILYPVMAALIVAWAVRAWWTGRAPTDPEIARAAQWLAARAVLIEVAR